MRLTSCNCGTDLPAGCEACQEMSKVVQMKKGRLYCGLWGATICSTFSGMILDTVDRPWIEWFAPMMTQHACATGDSDSRASQDLMTEHTYYMELYAKNRRQWVKTTDEHCSVMNQGHQPDPWFESFKSDSQKSAQECVLSHHQDTAWSC